MRIALLNPWSNAAENQAVASIQIAAKALSYEAIECKNSAAIEAVRPDFVLAMASQQPKLTGYPTYGLIHEPRRDFVNNFEEKFRNVLTYDGYFTISDVLTEFLTDLNYAMKKPNHIGFYYNTCFDPGPAAPPRLDPAVITYFGTNWDGRRRDFFKRLSKRKGVAIHGPQHSWRHISRAAYGGPMPFDGRSVLAKYWQNGVGLCLYSEHHLRDDVVSNRIFEIAAAGAVSITADMPWVRRYFGDTVLYVDQGLDNAALVDEILARAEWIRSNPAQARDMAVAANARFRERFSLERLLQDAVACHEKWTSEARVVCTPEGPLISVIVRAGERPLAIVRRALDSLARQSYRRIEVLLVVFSDLQVEPLQAEFAGQFVDLRTLRETRKRRSTTLWAGLRAIKGDYFAILDDDDELFPNHFSSLMVSIAEHEKCGRTVGVCHSGAVRQLLRPFRTSGGGEESRRIFSFAPFSPQQTLLESSAVFASNCFIARADLLDPCILEDPDMDTAEDSYLLLSLAQKTEPVFDFALTSLHHQSAETESKFMRHPRRLEDVAKLARRMFARPLSADEDLIVRFCADQAQAYRTSEYGTLRLLLELGAAFLLSLAANGLRPTLARTLSYIRHGRGRFERADD